MGKRSDKSPKRKGGKTSKVVVKHPKKTAWGATFRQPVEKKNLDFTLANVIVPGSTVATWSALTPINLIAQGTAPNQYIGRSLMMKKLMFRYMFNPNSTIVSNTTLGSFYQRLIIVYDKDVQNSVPAINDVLTTDDFGAFQNLDRTDRYVIIYDKIKAVHPDGQLTAGGGSTPGAISFFKGNIKLNHLMKFEGATAVISNISKGALYMATSQNGQGNFAGKTIAAQTWTRIRFTDQ